jgi:hypothetical protein
MFVLGPPLEAVKRAFDGTSYYHIEIFIALPFHVLSFSLHLGCSVLVYFLSKRIFKLFTMAFIVSLIFLVSPFQAEAVLWISGLQELLWVFSLLLAALFYTSTKEIGKTAIILTSLFTIIALLSNEYLMLKSEIKDLKNK